MATTTTRTRATALLAATALCGAGAAVAAVAATGGPAGAAAHGSAKVKRIAAKVVAQKAPGLSVAHAATAGDATTLGGRPAAAYAERVDRIDLVAPKPSQVLQFPLTGIPAGTWDVHWHLSADTAQPGASISCYLAVPGSSSQHGFAYGGSFNFGVAADGEALVTLPGPARRPRWSATWTARRAPARRPTARPSCFSGRSTRSPSWAPRPRWCPPPDPR